MAKSIVPAPKSDLRAAAPGPRFLANLLDDYVRNLPRFFDPTTGAVVEAQRDDGTPAFLFTEVTGYAIRELMTLYKMTADLRHFEHAWRAGAWLLNFAASPEGWMRTRHYFEHDDNPDRALYSFAHGNIFSFDSGICLNGLAALCEATRDPALMQHLAQRPELLGLISVDQLVAGSLALGDRLAALVNDKGSVPAIFNPRIGQKELRFKNPRWSQIRGSFHAKIAEALSELYLFSQDAKHAAAARRLCEFALTRQLADGRFATDKDGNTQLHPHCYSAEGVLRTGQVLGEERFIDSARKATDWALGLCERGVIPQEFGPTIKKASPFRTDALSQVLRLGARLIECNHGEETWWKPLSELAGRVLSMKDPRDGFYRYGFYEYQTPSKTVSYWTNNFAFSALLEYCAAWVCRNSTVLVLAGGIGSRCWPISCESNPKPLFRGFLGDRSLLEETVTRFTLAGCVLPKNVFILTTGNGVPLAREQMAALGIPAENIIEEPKPEGTLGALRFALAQIGKAGKEILLLSMADNLIRPIESFRAALLRAALAAHLSEDGLVLSLGVPTSELDSRYGHAVFRTDNEVIPGVYAVDRFIEKPKEALKLAAGEKFTWDSGCVVARLGYLRTILKELVGVSGDLSRKILENRKFHLAVSPYPPNIRFVDVGAPGHDLRRFFMGAEPDRGHGNVSLGRGVDVTFLRAARNIVISDQKPIEIVGLTDHLIIDNRVTNTAVVLPLTKVDTLPEMYRMFLGVDQFRPFIAGGPASQNAQASQMTRGCSGKSSSTSSHGLALAIHCADVRVERTPERLRVVFTGHTEFSDHDVNVLIRKRHEPDLVTHLMDVTYLADQCSQKLSMSEEARKLLHLLCLVHDYGGFLSAEGANTEMAIASKIAQITSLNWRSLDSRVLQTLIRTSTKVKLTAKEEELLPNFNDTINSAIEILDIEHIRAHPLLDELLFLLCNQDHPGVFRAPVEDYFKARPCRLSQADILKIYGCLRTAEVWFGVQSMWKRQLFPRDEEDGAQALAAIVHMIRDTGGDPAPIVKFFSDAIVDEDSALSHYTSRELRFIPLPDGDRHYVPPYGSTLVYRHFLREKRVTKAVTQAISHTLAEGQEFEKRLLLWLPHNLHAIATFVGVTSDAVKSLAQAIMQKCLSHHQSVWSRHVKARDSLLEVLRDSGAPPPTGGGSTGPAQPAGGARAKLATEPNLFFHPPPGFPHETTASAHLHTAPGRSATFTPPPRARP